MKRKKLKVGEIKRGKKIEYLFYNGQYIRRNRI